MPRAVATSVVGPILTRAHFSCPTVIGGWLRSPLYKLVGSSTQRSGWALYHDFVCLFVSFWATGGSFSIILWAHQGTATHFRPGVYTLHTLYLSYIRYLLFVQCPLSPVVHMAAECHLYQYTFVIQGLPLRS